MHDESIIPSSVPRLKTLVDSELNSHRWQDKLLPVDTVLGEEDVAVLRQELETAHNLLQYQQCLIDSLTEQLVGHESHRAQLEQDLENAERDAHREAEKLQEFQSICQDLRSQLRRQQARICEYKTVLKNNSNTFVPNAKVTPRQMVSFGYATVAVDDSLLTSSSAVSPWSATDPSSVSDAFAICCRKLAALGLQNTGGRQTSPQTVALPTSQSSVEKQSPPTVDVEIQPSYPSSPQPELPNFVH
ncbi:hypothetical protein [Acaryochloris marina]|uniref:Uncharacterized protein n=1 Tax=Acaryochloris marina (strain MBIC 11017) TaxID=329726 RepID=B0CAD5_ACAM1|nr:hypothetical protein [Acaryochloris marina]ABW27870.1 hypothetical protein AM1_2871 [Acaryochloris marina MBIC11017]BDM82594.1 hypothetical protein AM10699_54550 [Acaryochloris marina MBIC10699]